MCFIHNAMCSWAYGMTLGYGSVQDLQLDSMILVGLFDSALSVILCFWWMINTYFYIARIGRGIPQPRRLHPRIWNIYVSTRAGKKRSLLTARREPRRQKVIEPHTWILDSVRQSSASAEVSGVTWEKPDPVCGRGQHPECRGICFFPGSSVQRSDFWNNTGTVLQ